MADDKPTTTAPAAEISPPPASVSGQETPLSLPLILTNIEESNRIKDLSDNEKMSLTEFKQLVQEAITNKDSNFTPNSQKPTSETNSNHENISIWGIPLLQDSRTDIILLKFLKARDFIVIDSFIMLKNTLRWRKAFSIDVLINLGDDLEKVVFMHGVDKEGHPICYNVYGEFENKELYEKTFADEEKRTRFLKWRIQFLERSIRKLDFRPGGSVRFFRLVI